jgi:hypothetical protein
MIPNIPAVHFRIHPKLYPILFLKFKVDIRFSIPCQEMKIHGLVEEHLPSKPEALNSNPNVTKKKKKTKTQKQACEVAE